jgi:catechol 2,3-dioxygenase-like lactoylglutathione lyase family enzyme
VTAGGHGGRVAPAGRLGRALRARGRACLAGLALIFLSTPAWAQLSPPNSAGVAMGHLHYHVRDVEANKRFWVSLGGTPVMIGTTEAIKFPDVFVVLTKGESFGGTAGSVVNHVAFRVRSLAKLQEAGFDVQLLAQFPGVGSVTTPEGERIELFDNTAGNVTFTPDPGQTDAGADRHNHPVTAPIIAYHIHLYLPEGSEAKAKAWYAKMFGAVPGMRWRYPAADLPGINMNFSDQKQPMAPTRGRMLDHIGFEVKDLPSFCRKLEAAGVTFDVPYRKDSSGVASALLTDPWGTSIELTEGFNQR